MSKRCSEQEKAQWSDWVKQQKSSNNSAASWCREQKVHYDKFIYWRSRLTNEEKDPTFQELLSEEKSGICIECSDVRIHLERGFDPSVLKSCLIAIRGL